MTIYTETLTITAPVVLADVASRIARAIDPDVGGAKSFRLDPGGETISVTTPCTPEYKALMLSLQADPAALHVLVVADYVARWPDLVAPTLSECEAFCAGVVIDGGVAE